MKMAVSNINRQLPRAFHGGLIQSEDARAIADISPECQVTLVDDLLTIDNVNDLVPGDVDYVVDCIDSLSCKVALVVESHNRALKVASSMGAGKCLDPAHVKVADISKTDTCPLAKQMDSSCANTTASTRAY